MLSKLFLCLKKLSLIPGLTSCLGSLGFGGLFGSYLIPDLGLEPADALLGLRLPQCSLSVLVFTALALAPTHPKVFHLLLLSSNLSRINPSHNSNLRSVAVFSRRCSRRHLRWSRSHYWSLDYILVLLRYFWFYLDRHCRNSICSIRLSLSWCRTLSRLLTLNLYFTHLLWTVTATKRTTWSVAVTSLSSPYWVFSFIVYLYTIV